MSYSSATCGSARRIEFCGFLGQAAYPASRCGTARPLVVEHSVPYFRPPVLVQAPGCDRRSGMRVPTGGDRRGTYPNGEARAEPCDPP